MSTFGPDAPKSAACHHAASRRVTAKGSISKAPFRTFIVAPSEPREAVSTECWSSVVIVQREFSETIRTLCFLSVRLADPNR